MSELYEHIRQKNPEGLSYNEAAQLFLWLFCSSDLIPTSLRKTPINKETLIDVFQKLSADGLILDLPPQDTDNRHDCLLWRALVESLLLNRIELDPGFPARAKQYL